MAYRNKTYVCFDADTDMDKYEDMIKWKENDQIAFNFYNAHELNNLQVKSNDDTIKKKLRERLQNTKLMIVLVGKHTKYLYKFVRWEIEYALEKDIPIIVANLNGKRTIDNNLCPSILKEKLALHVCYNQKVLDMCMKFWIDMHFSYKEKDKLEGTKTAELFLLDNAYKKLGL